MAQMHTILLLVLLGTANAAMKLVNGKWVYDAGTTIVTTLAPVITLAPYTTTQTPWDSSNLVSGSSGMSSGSFKSLSSGSFDNDKSSISGSASSSGPTSDLSGSNRMAGSNQSGSSGFYLKIWQWALCIPLCCCCLVSCGLGAFMAKPNKPKKAPTRQREMQQPPMPPPAAEPFLEQRAFSTSTIMTAPANAGDTKLNVADTTGFQTGHEIMIGDELNRVAGLGSILLATPLRQAHPAGTLIKNLEAARPDVVPELVQASFPGMPELVPLPTTSTPIPSYSPQPSYQQPYAQSYAAPATYAPQTQAYAQPYTMQPTAQSYATAFPGGSQYQQYGGSSQYTAGAYGGTAGNYRYGQGSIV